MSNIILLQDNFTLNASLVRIIAQFWPTDTAKESLFDLGEHKQQVSQNFPCAIDHFISWLNTYQFIPTQFSPPSNPFQERPVSRETISKTAWLLGEGQLVRKLSQLLIKIEKTLNNSLTTFQYRKIEHLWIKSIIYPDLDINLILFHRRTRQALHTFWHSLLVRCQTHDLDLQDYLVLVSLIALYQRRRNTDEVRANRRSQKSRKITPKPISKLFTSCIARCENIVETCANTNSIEARQLALMSIEETLTYEHMQLFPKRNTKDTQIFVKNHIINLNKIKKILDKPKNSQLLESETYSFSRRINLMLAYAQNEHIDLIEKIDEHSYITASHHLAWLHQHRQNLEQTAASDRIQRLQQLWEADAPGLAMLKPQIDSWQQRLEST